MHKFEMALRTGEHGQLGTRTTSQYPLFLLADIPPLKDAHTLPAPTSQEVLTNRIQTRVMQSPMVDTENTSNLTRMQSQSRPDPN